MDLQMHFKGIAPLGNLHILECKEASAILAIFLSLDAQSFHHFYLSPTLQSLCEKYCKNFSFKGVMQVQYTLLLNLEQAFKHNPKATQELLKKTLKNLESLENASLTKSELLPNIKEYFNTLIAQTIPTQHTKDAKLKLPQNFYEDFFHASLCALKEQKATIDSILESFPYLKEQTLALETLLQKINHQHFSLGITGVFNAGKSTLLNALLGAEILGSSTLPETASLTRLRYAKESSAKVYFWNKQEWEDIQATLLESQLQELFANATFSKAFATYIRDENYTLDISLEELPKYTSANTPSKLCHLIKQTLLFTPLKFLEHSVEIVDTPGLDDPMIQRETITKNYLLNCDVLIHAMNAAQSATQVDRDFIVQSLQNANLSRILIVLTHADLLEAKDLEDALNYTKSSIEENILNSFSSEQAQLLLKRLDCIPLASYPALLCQTHPKRAKELGYSLEASNFNALLRVLERTLLGTNSTKAKDLIYLCAQGFLRTYGEIQQAITLEKTLLFAKEQDIKVQITQAKAQKTQSLEQLKTAKTALDSAKEEFEAFLKILQKQLYQHLQDAQNTLNERIFIDIMYNKEKGNTTDEARLEYLLEIGLKDILSDVLRFSAQHLTKKITQLQGYFVSHLDSLDTHKPLMDKNFNLHFTAHFYKKTKRKLLNRILKTAKTRESQTLKTALATDFKWGFLELIKTLMQECQTLQESYITHFNHLLDTIEAHLHTDLNTKETILQNALKSLCAQDKQEREKILTQALTQMAQNTQFLQTLQDYATRDSNA